MYITHYDSEVWNHREGEPYINTVACGIDDESTVVGLTDDLTEVTCTECIATFA